MMRVTPPKWLVRYLTRLAIGSIPDEIICPGKRWRKRDGLAAAMELTNPFLFRWFVIPKNRWINLYYHNFTRDDEDRALHDHPWWNLSWVIRGQYIEHTITAGGIHVHETVRTGHLKFRRAKAAHRVELVCGLPSWSLFMTGPVVRKWGFHCPKGWRSSDEFGAKGGCDD